MLDRIFTSLLMLSALLWTVASFGAALHLNAAATAAPSQVPSVRVELERVVVSGRRELPATPLAQNESWRPAAAAAVY